MSGSCPGNNGGEHSLTPLNKELFQCRHCGQLLDRDEVDPNICPGDGNGVNEGGGHNWVVPNENRAYEILCTFCLVRRVRA